MGYGLSGSMVNGREVWIKGGASPSHSAVLAVVPELDLGIFIAVNRQEPFFWERLIPTILTQVDSGKAAPRDGPRTVAVTNPAVLGTYLWTRAPLRSVEKVIGLAAQIRVTSAGPDVVVSGSSEVAGRWVPVDSLSFRRTDGRVLGFRLDSSGVASYAFTIVQGQPASFERIPPYSSTTFQLGALALGTAAGLVAAGTTLFRGRRESSQPAWARVATVTMPVAEITTLVAGIGLSRQSDLLQQGSTPLLHVALGLATATGVVALAQVAGSATLGVRSAGGSMTRGAYLLGAAGGAAIFWFLSSNNLVRLPFM
jgi:hypothetical protein